MKKIYLSAIVLAFSSISFGQAINQKVTFNHNDLALESKSHGNTINDKILGAVIWSNSFDTPTDSMAWTLDNSSQTGAAYGWSIDAVSDGWWSAAGITSTSGGNFAELSNGDATAAAGSPTSQALNVTYTMTSATSIDLIALGGAGSETATLEFEQFGARFNDLTEIQISTDGTNFVTIGDNLDFDIHSTSASNVWPNPNLKRINLSTFLTAATATTVWLRFSWTTNFPGSASDPNVWVAYGWYIDDIKIRTAPTNELIISDGYAGSQGLSYSRIPTSQIQPIEYTTKVKNEGATDQYNAFFNAIISSGSTLSSPPVNILVGATDSLVATTWTPPTTVGIPYTTTFVLESDSTDDIPSTDTLTFPAFEITNNVYALDDYGTTGTPANGGGESGNGTGLFEFEAGNYFDAVADHVVGSIEVVIGTDATASAANPTLIDVVLYLVDAGGTFVEVSRSIPYTLTASDIGSTLRLDLFSVPNPIIIAGSTYFAAVHAFAGDFSYGTSGTSPDGQGTAPQASLIFYPNMSATTNNFYTSNTPMVRLILEASTVGVEEASNEVKFSVYPNPSNGVFNINLSSNDANNINLTVKNVVGQTVINETVSVSGNTTHKISLTDYSKGIYFLTVGNETTKLIVE